MSPMPQERSGWSLGVLGLSWSIRQYIGLVHCGTVYILRCGSEHRNKGGCTGNFLQGIAYRLSLRFR